PVEGVLESYSLPKKGEIDPTNVMAIFYYILFGMMLSDAAYGLIMVIACGIILLKFKDINEGLKKSLQMFFFCGISTTFWGIMYGSYFGDVVDVVSQTFFGVHLTIPPLWFAPINEPMRLLMFSLLVGVVHVFTGLAMQFVQLVKAKKYKDILYDVIFWYGLVGGLIVVLLSTQMFIDIAQLSFILPSICGTVGGIVAAVSAVGIICTSGRESKNPFKRFLKGLYGLYNVTGYLSDILSYSRLLALGLATGVIATVVNKMGSMAGDGIVGAILFIIVFIAGHLINIGINLLGAYVHTNRLQYVEFFGKFYEGGGRKFKPFAINSKYFKIREETK
ncbi:MAG: V-type ATPase 116kDa subunit family protein, partial [Oscillospiraceae bacterium]